MNNLDYDTFVAHWKCQMCGKVLTDKVLHSRSSDPIERRELQREDSRSDHKCSDTQVGYTVHIGWTKEEG